MKPYTPTTTSAYRDESQIELHASKNLVEKIDQEKDQPSALSIPIPKAIYSKHNLVFVRVVPT